MESALVSDGTAEAGALLGTWGRDAPGPFTITFREDGTFEGQQPNGNVFDTGEWTLSRDDQLTITTTMQDTPCTGTVGVYDVTFGEDADGVDNIRLNLVEDECEPRSSPNELPNRRLRRVSDQASN